MMTVFQLVRFECDKCKASAEVRFPQKYLGCFMAPHGWIARRKDGIGLIHFCPECAEAEKENEKNAKE